MATLFGVYVALLIDHLELHAEAQSCAHCLGGFFLRCSTTNIGRLFGPQGNLGVISNSHGLLSCFGLTSRNWATSSFWPLKFEKSSISFNFDPQKDQTSTFF